MDSMELLSDMFIDEYQENATAKTCFDYSKCTFNYTPCRHIHEGYRYNDTSAAWVLISSIIVFFMKAGFLLIELAFAQNVREKRHIVVVKHLDAFASAFGFFLLGFDYVSQYTSPQGIASEFFQISDPVLWFFKFTFASNAATILGGCLVTSNYKLRLPAAFLSAFIISGLIHPAIARLIWTDKDSLSVYRFCGKNIDFCGDEMAYHKKLYVLDFGGGGAVHLLGGVAGLVLCLFAKLHGFLENRKQNRNRFRDEAADDNDNNQLINREQPDRMLKRDFWEWMYPVDGGGETTSEAALGVLILWFCWFAFNCGSTESVQSSPLQAINFPQHGLPSVIAVNMILSAASGGVVAVIIASWAQIRSQSDSVNANEIANGILSALVAISAGCPFVEYWAACVIGAVAVLVYHFGCWLEYKFGIDDTARIVPVHGLCGFWSMIAASIFLLGDKAECTLHATFEGICFCSLRLPHLTYGERLGAQVLGALVMIGITAIGSILMYGILYLLPMKSQMSSTSRFAKFYNRVMSRIFLILFNRETVNFEGNWLFTGPSEIPHPDSRILRNIINQRADDTDSEVDHIVRPGSVQRNYGAVRNNSETLGTVNHPQTATLAITNSGNYTTADANPFNEGNTSNYITANANQFYEAIEEDEEEENEQDV